MTRAYVCIRCQEVSGRWVVYCPYCNGYETLRRAPDKSRAVSIGDVVPPNAEPITRLSTGLPSVDLVLGGGIVLGSVIIIGGDPGQGKSTLLLWIAELLARANYPTLYIAGEESAEQIAARAKRIGAQHSQLKILAETDAVEVAREMRALRPKVTFIDSLQTMIHPEWEGYPPDSPTQLKACAGFLCGKAKQLQSAMWLVGHVDKQGNLRGPNTVMHLVDAVLYLEGDPNEKERALLGVKNRWGATDPVALLEMRADGLKEKEPEEETKGGRRKASDPKEKGKGKR